MIDEQDKIAGVGDADDGGDGEVEVGEDGAAQAGADDALDGLPEGDRRIAQLEAMVHTDAYGEAEAQELSELLAARPKAAAERSERVIEEGVRDADDDDDDGSDGLTFSAEDLALLDGVDPEDDGAREDVPASPDEYVIARPEGYTPTADDDALDSAAKGVFHSLGLSQQQVDGLVKFVADTNADAAARAPTSADVDARLAEIVGHDQVQSTLEAAGRVWNQIGASFGDGDGDLSFLAASGLGNSAAFIAGLAKLGETGAAEPATPEAERRALEAKIGTDAYSDADAKRLQQIISAAAAGKPPPPSLDSNEVREVAKLEGLIGTDFYGDKQAKRLSELLARRKRA